MFSQPLPLGQWKQHTTDNGQPYIHNPLTGDVRWLYSRFFDTKTQRDYLVNIVTNERIWATKENDYLCPKPEGWTPKSSSDHTKADVPTPSGKNRPAETGEFHVQDSARKGSKNHSLVNSPTNPAKAPSVATSPPSCNVEATVFSNGASMPARPPPAARPGGSAYEAAHLGPQDPALKKQPVPHLNSTTPAMAPSVISDGNKLAADIDSPVKPSASSRGKVRESNALDSKNHRQSPRPMAINPPEFLSLGPDEVLMVDPRTSRRYIFNRRTRHSRWLTDVEASTNLQNENTSPAKSASQQPSNTPSPLKLPTEAANDIQCAIRGFMTRRVKVLQKLRLMADTLRDIDSITQHNGSHDLQLLTSVMSGTSDSAITPKEAVQKLLQLGELCTQKMLKVDGVDTVGNAYLRQRRKFAITRILGIIEKVDALRTAARE